MKSTRAVALACVGALLLSACATQQQPAASASSVPATPAKGYQWLHGSGEAAALQTVAYRSLTTYVLAQVEARKAGRAVQGAILAANATADAPAFVPCGDKPAAIVLDVDETSILNTGANYDAARRGDPPFDPARWAQWEQTGGTWVEPLPGAVEALRTLRAAGVTPVFVTNRSAATAESAVAALNAAGLGPAEHNKTLFLQGDVAPGSGKDPRRAAVAANYCVLALGGDQLGDFSDLFNVRGRSLAERRALAQTSPLAARWGAGWFVMPNPLYGSGITGGYDDIFPAGKRWPGPEGAGR